MHKLICEPGYYANSVSYVTKKVDSSIKILSSPEEEVVLDALTYLLEYSDVQPGNLSHIQRLGALKRLFNLLDRSDCVLRLALRLLGLLLTDDYAFNEIEQYDDKIVKISELYVEHTDQIIKYLCTFVLSKLASSKRIIHLILRADLFYHILDTNRTTTDPEVLEWNLDLFLKLLGVPGATDILSEISELDLSLLVNELERNSEEKVVSLIFEVILELTNFGLYVFQEMFREAKVVEKMLDVVMDPDTERYHKVAFDIIMNCMKSDETSDYFIETLQFLKFCQWAKTCEEEYHFPCIFVLEQLTRIPFKRQILFDLSVEQTILSFFRSNEKRVLNKTCEAVTNMVTHKYCFEAMLKPATIKSLFYILLRKDEEDPKHEVALKTIVAFTKGSFYALDMIYRYGAYKVILVYFKKRDFTSGESFLSILEILNRLSLHPLYQHDIIGISLTEKLLYLFHMAPLNIATSASEVMVNLADCNEFDKIFLAFNGPKIFVDVLKSSKDEKILRNILFFIYRNLIRRNLMTNFFRSGLVKVLQDLPELLQYEIPIFCKILKLIYDQNLPLKFFYTNKLDINDKLKNKFFLIDGQWKADFPLPEDLEEIPLSPAYAIYVVDYSFKLEDVDVTSLEENKSTLTQIAYGKLSADPFLPTYINDVTKDLAQTKTFKEKVKLLARYVHAVLGTLVEKQSKIDKIHHVKLHVELLKHKLGSSLLPVGFLRLGDCCTRALLFKAIADKCHIPTSLVKGKGRLYWNEVFVIDQSETKAIRLCVVDLLHDIGNLLVVGSRWANQYCHIIPWVDDLTEWNERDIEV